MTAVPLADSFTISSFSTTDLDQHNLHLNFSDNLMLSLADGSVWVRYEGLLYRMFVP
ncbi:MAG: hypothetical protein KDC85_13035 [Saprospiraceae bacterium]|nr:hypothetical protein [Saprospiraceae bacterium]